MASNEQLPPGWNAEWNAEYQRYLFIELATGRTQWEHPQDGLDVEGVAAPEASQATSRPKKRQYAAGESQAYYGNTEPAFDQSYPQHIPGQPGGPQFFTPGANDGYPGLAQNPTQGGYYGPPAVGAGQPYPGEGYNQGHPPAGPGAMDQLAGQFGQMNVAAQPQYGQGIGGQKPYALYTTNLLTTPPDPYSLQQPPPEIRLPPGSSISQSPFSNADPSYQRCTLNAIPTTQGLLNKSKVPFALVCAPFRSVKPGEEEVPVVSDSVVARCRRCRAYINPYVTFIDGGSRYKCVLCGVSNEVPQLFDWDSVNNQPADRWQRAELNHAVVDFTAPAEYLVRPPQPLVYVFLIDLSFSAIQSGMVATATRTILESLERIPNADNRTKIAIIGFDAALYFFSLTPETTESNMMVVSDIEDVFLPKPTDLLVNLTECRAGIEGLLGRINEMFAQTASPGSAMGPALQAGYKLISSIGGKMIVLSASLPTLGEGALKDRDDPKLYGTAKESNLLQPASSFYKTFAIDCSRSQISVDMFLFSGRYQDIATLSCLPRYTCGQTFFYPAFSATRQEDALKFAHEFGWILASPIGLEALTRIRLSKGLRLSAFHGNFFVRSTDLLAFSAVPVDQSYCIEITHEDQLTTPFVVLQTGILYTSCYGERRIRVVTTALPTTSNLSEVYSSVDQIAVATYLANKSVERALSSKLEDARDAVTNKVVDILTAYKNSMTGGGGGGQLATSDNMKMLPVLALGLLKHVAIRQSATIPSDLRAYAQALLTSIPAQLLMPYLYPNFYSLHDMPPECGLPGDDGKVVMPPLLPLSSERLVRHGLFLIEDGQTLFLWVGRDAVPQLVADVFDLPSYDQLPSGKITLPLLDNPFSQRVNAVIAKTREVRRGPYWPHLYLVREDGEPALRLWALSALIHDRADQAPSYQQYVNMLRDKVAGSSY